MGRVKRRAVVPIVASGTDIASSVVVLFLNVAAGLIVISVSFALPRLRT